MEVTPDTIPEFDLSEFISDFHSQLWGVPIEPLETPAPITLIETSDIILLPFFAFLGALIPFLMVFFIFFIMLTLVACVFGGYAFAIIKIVQYATRPQSPPKYESKTTVEHE